MGFDDLRPRRARTYDTWGMIGTKHGAEAPAPLPTLGDILGEAFAKAKAAASAPSPLKAEEDLEEGDPCPGCGHALSWITRNACHPSYSVQLGCEICGERFGESFP